MTTTDHLVSDDVIVAFMAAPLCDQHTIALGQDLDWKGIVHCHKCARLAVGAAFRAYTWPKET